MASVWLKSTESFWGWFMSHLEYAFNLDLWPAGEAAAFFYDLECLVHVETGLVSLFTLNQENVHNHIWNSSSSVTWSHHPWLPPVHGCLPWMSFSDIQLLEPTMLLWKSTDLLISCFQRHLHFHESEYIMPLTFGPIYSHM